MGCAVDIFRIAQGHHFGEARWQALHALINCGEAADEFVDEVAVLARGNGLFAGDTSTLHMQVVAAEFIARHGRTAAATEALIGLSATGHEVIRIFSRISYKNLVEDEFLDERDLSDQQR